VGKSEDRAANFRKALARLEHASSVPDPSEFVYDSVIQRFEFVFELAWKLMKATLDSNGVEAGMSPREILKSAFAMGYVDDDAVWLAMLTARNVMSHTYSEVEARKVYDLVKSDFLPVLIALGRRTW
jgi:nucleotidyltransferase substrate binding protein (TIGR01987 family)